MPHLGSRVVTKLTDKTLIPLSSIGIIAAVMVWVLSLYSRVEYNEGKVIELNENNKIVNVKLDDISQRLSKIEGFLVHLTEQLKENSK